MEREAHLQGILHISQKPHLSCSQVKKPSLRSPSWNPSHRDAPPTTALLHSSTKAPGIRAPPHIPGSPRVERGPHGERCPHPETFLTYLPGAPVKELPLRSPQYHIISHHISYRIISYHTISFDKYLETLKQAFTVYILTVFNAVCVDKS